MSDIYAITNASPFSSSKPKFSIAGRRAIFPKWSGATLSEYRAKVRSGARFIAKIDVARCYSSIYTHSIPWALHTKAMAKKAVQDQTLNGNVIDKVLRENQDRQTIGIPIGPDTSFVLAELILSSVDINVGAGLAGKGWRWYDDFEVGFDSEDSANSFCALLERELANFELEINAGKTEILRLPQGLEDAWFGPLQAFELKSDPKSQASSLIDLFNRAFIDFSKFPKVGLLKYTVKKLYKMVTTPKGDRPIVHPFNWDLAQHLIAQVAVVEPDALPTVLGLISFYDSQGMVPDKPLLSATLSQIVGFQATRGLSSEVAWSIWGFIEHRLQIPDDTAQIAVQSGDDIVALLMLHARSLSLVSGVVDFAPIETIVTSSTFESDHWLLAYESFHQGWLNTPTTDYISGNVHASALNSSRVHFYRTNLRSHESARHVFGTPSWLIDFLPYP